MSKEAVLLCIDSGHSMDEKFDGGSSRLRVALECARITIQQKLFNNPTHEVGMLLFGDNDSDDGNSLMLHPLSRPEVAFVRKLQQLSHSAFENARPGGDIFSALRTSVRAIDQHCGTKKYNKRLFLFTNGAGASVLDAPDMRVIAEGVRSAGIKINIIPIDFMTSYDSNENRLGGEPMHGVQERNASLLMRLREM